MNDEPPMSIVVRFKKAVDKAKIANFAKATEQTKNGKFGQLPPVPLLSHLPEDPEVRT